MSDAVTALWNCIRWLRKRTLNQNLVERATYGATKSNLPRQNAALMCPWFHSNVAVDDHVCRRRRSTRTHQRPYLSFALSLLRNDKPNDRLSRLFQAREPPDDWLL